MKYLLVAALITLGSGCATYTATSHYGRACMAQCRTADDQCNTAYVVANPKPPIYMCDLGECYGNCPDVKVSYQ